MYTFFFLFFGCAVCAACGILVPQPGIKPVPCAVKAWSPNHWTAREFPKFHYILTCHTYLLRLGFTTCCRVPEYQWLKQDKILYLSCKVQRCARQGWYGSTNPRWPSLCPLTRLLPSCVPVSSWYSHHSCVPGSRKEEETSRGRCVWAYS